MEEKYFNGITSAIILVVLIVLTFLLIRPVLLSVIVGFILAFVFNPIYKYFVKRFKSKNLSAFLICIILLLIIVIPFWFVTPIIIEQSLQVYFELQSVDFITPLRDFFPSFFATEEFASEVGSILYSFVNRTANYLTNAFSSLVLQVPELALQFLVVLFTLFFVLKDQKELIHYIRSMLPFSNEVKKRMFDSSRDITFSVLYGQVIVGIIQGLLVGAGFFIFGVRNALLLTIFATIAGIFPIIGPTIIWIPVAIYLLVNGDIFATFGVVVFGILASLSDNFLRPMIIAQKTSLHPALILVSMIGGLFFMGILGFIIGPLIVAYLLIIIEVYRGKKTLPLLVEGKDQSKDK